MLFNGSGLKITEWKSPGLADNVAIGDNPWNNPSNVLAADTTYATSIISTALENTQRLRTQNYNFSIPASSIISAEIKVKGYKIAGSSNELQLYLLDETGSLIFGEKRLNFTGTDATYTVGGFDRWSTELTLSQVTNTNFGCIAFATGEYLVNLPSTWYVDHIQMRLYYI
jgi:hypothetical protein